MSKKVLVKSKTFSCVSMYGHPFSMHTYKNCLELIMKVNTYNSSSWETEGGGLLRVWSLSWLLATGKPCLRKLIQTNQTCITGPFP